MRQIRYLTPMLKLSSRTLLSKGLFLLALFASKPSSAVDIYSSEEEMLIDVEQEIAQWAPVQKYDEYFKNSKEIADNAKESDRYFITNKKYWATFWEDAKSLATSPSRMDKKDWAIAAAVVAGGVGLVAIDDDIQDWVRDNRNDTTQQIFDTVDTAFNPYLYAPALLASYLYARQTGNTRLRRTSLMAIEMLTVAQIVNVPLKALAGRSRPKKGESTEFGGPTYSLGPSSFVSGHAIAAFGVATIFSMEYGKDKPWVPYVSFTLATLVGLQRIHEDQHWASDVFLGSAIGVAVGLLIYRNAEARPDWMILPDIKPGQYGLMVKHEFGADERIRLSE